MKLLSGGKATPCVDAAPRASVFQKLSSNCGLTRMSSIGGASRIDRAILSHPHPDHYLGFLSLSMPVDELDVARETPGDPGRGRVASRLPGYAAVEAMLVAQGTHVEHPPLGVVASEAGVELEVWGPRSPVAGLRERILRAFSPPLFPLDFRDVPAGVTFHDLPVDSWRIEDVTLRSDLVPATLGRIPGVETAVTGSTAENIDFTHDMKRGVPYVIAFVLTLAFVLLLVAFRSIVVPLKAIALNLLSVGASYGLLVLVFQHHWAEPILGFKSNGLIISWLPLFLFVILFGLSMDYHVFILSRVREAYDRGMRTEDAVAHGIKATAATVTSAAVVMVAVFAIFATLSSLDFKQMGVGLAVAILLDATIVRAVLLPATMKLLGDWNWYLPKKLEWLPKVSHEPMPEPARA